MNAQEWKPLISAYADGALTPEETAVAEKLLAERPECRAYLEEIRRLSQSLEIIPDEDLSPDAELKILSHIKKESSMKPYHWKAAAGVAAMFLVVVLVLNSYLSRGLQGRLVADRIMVPATVGRVENNKAGIQGRLKSATDDIGDQFSTSSAANYLSLRKRPQEKVRHTATTAPTSGRDLSSASVVEGKAKTGVYQYEPYYGAGRASGSKENERASYKPQPSVSKLEYKADRVESLDRKKGYVAPAAAPAVGGSNMQYEPYYLADRSTAALPAQSPQGAALGVNPMNQPTQVFGEYWGGGTQSYDKSGYDQGRAYYYHNDQYYQNAPANTEEYQRIDENDFLSAMDNPLSTLSADVDTASYANIRRYLSQRQLPPADSVRVEEMINYFSYDYPQPSFFQPFSITTDLAVCPWNQGHQLLRVGLKGKIPNGNTLPPSNLVFLIDVSGSMSDANKLPLLKEGFKMMVQQLRPEDYVSIVVYAGHAGQVLAPTSGADKYSIINAIDHLQAGGSTAGGEGIQLAYELALQSFIRGGNNRVILATDGDFNVGVSNTADLVRMIEDRKRDGIFLTVLGFGEDNLKDSRMMQLADKGNGNYFYIDSLQEAQKVMVSELGSTLFTIAKDVKIQIEFNPAAVKAYRLIGYEKRLLAKEDFNNDQKDAGEIGAGHTVTALYEIIPAGFWSSMEPSPKVDPLKYQKKPAVVTQGNPNEVVTVKLRYKDPDGDASKLITRTVRRSDFTKYPTGDFAWASAVAEFGMLLRGSRYAAGGSYEQVLDMARNNITNDAGGARSEFLSLVESARSLDRRPRPQPVWSQEEYDNNYDTDRQGGDGQINFK